MNPIISLVLVGAAVWGFFGFIEPRYDTVKVLKGERAEYLGALNEVRRIEDRLAALRASYSGISSTDLDRLSKLVPDVIDTVRLILDIDSIASRHSLALKNIQVESQTSGGGKEAATEPSREVAAASSPARDYGTFKVSFSISTSYENLIGFLADIETSLRILDLTSLELRAGPASNIYEVSLGFTTYYLK